MLTITVQHLYYNMEDSFSQAKQAAGVLATCFSWFINEMQKLCKFIISENEFSRKQTEKNSLWGKLFFLTCVYDEKKDGLNRQGNTQV